MPKQVLHERTVADLEALKQGDRFQEVIRACAGVSDPIGDLFDSEELISIGGETARQRLVLSSFERERAPLAVRAACRKLLEGRNIDQFAIHWSDEWLNYIPGELHDPKSPGLLERPKLVIKRTAAALTAAVDSGEDEGFYYPLNTVFGLVPKHHKQVGLHFVESLLNSTFLDSYYKRLFGAARVRGGNLEFDELLRHLPIRIVDFDDSLSARREFAEGVATAFDRGIAEGDVSAAEQLICESIVSSTGRPLSATAHDAIAALGQRIGGIKKRRARLVRSFVLELEGALDARSFAGLRRLWTPPVPGVPMSSAFMTRVAAARNILNELFDQQILLSDSLALSRDQWRWLVLHRLGATPNLGLVSEIHESFRQQGILYDTQVHALKDMLDRLVPQLYGVQPADAAAM